VESDEGMRRIAAAPISWGICEVPGWGRQLAPDRVLGEMASLGITATELGAAGWLPRDPGAVRELLARYGLTLVGGFVPLALHEPGFDGARAEAEASAELLATAGADVFVAAIVADAAWSPRFDLDDGQWRRLVEHLARVRELVAARGLELAVHPHVGTLIETAEDVERLIERSDAPICFDSGHLLIGGVDPAAFVRDHADRIGHVHLKDVDAGVAARLTAGELTLMQAVQAGLFLPLGQGDANIGEVVRLLDAEGYEGRLVLEQDTAITGQEPPVGSGPVVDVKASIDFIANTPAPRMEEERSV
jgi:inosose dehydratase